MTYEYEYEKTWMLASVVLHRKAGQLLIEGFHVNLIPKSQKALNAFNLSEKGPLHFAFLGLAVVIPLFVVTTLVVCYRTTIAKRKWLWYLFVALGLVQFSLNWTTGAWNIQPISFLLLGAGFTQAGPYAPLVLTFALPVVWLCSSPKENRWPCAVMPNPSLKLSPNGVPPGPRGRAVYHRPRGPGVTPSVPA